MMITTKQITSEDEWNKAVEALGGHPLQLWGWGTVKAAHSWRVGRVLVYQGDQPVAGAQYLIKRLPRPFRPYVYIPRGPFGSHSAANIATLTDYIASNTHPLSISSEPDTVGEKPWAGWRRSNNKILLARTAVLDIRKTEDELLAGMSKKTRQYIRKSAKEGVTVRQAETNDDIAHCLDLYKSTAVRAGFALHDDNYYYDIAAALGKNSPIYIAEKEGVVVAFLWPIVTSGVAFELYGGMSEQGQALRANYHLKWHVIQTLKARGVQRYDVNGLLNDGVTAFKKGFIPEETQMSGTFDMPVRKLQYLVWNTLLPVVKRIVQAVRR